MKKYLLLFSIFFEAAPAISQTNSAGSVKAIISNAGKAALDNATVLLLKEDDSTVVKIQVSDSGGIASFTKVNPGKYLLKATHIGYNNFLSQPFSVNKNEPVLLPVQMDTLEGYLKEVSIEAHKPFIELNTNKTVVNMDASLTSMGSSVLETLEKLPGVSIDRNGGIALKGKTGVLILIDGKQTYLGGSDLTNYLSGFTSEQVSEIEIIEHPSSKYEASGSAGVINIKTKKSSRQGVYGSITSTFAQGKFPKSNNSFIFNIHKGAINFFINYNLVAFGTYVKLYAYRKYFEADNSTVQSILVQDFYMFTKGYNHNIRTGIDYTLSPRASLNITLSGIFLSRTSDGNSIATWQNDQAIVDSSSTTNLGYYTTLKNRGVSVSFHKTFSKNAEWSIDADVLGYKNGGTSLFENINPINGAIQTYLGDMPGSLHIFSAKSDFSKKINDKISYEAGLKSSYTNTDNLAAYAYNDGSGFQDDLEKSNHFLYKETNQALYGTAKIKSGTWLIDGGMRLEFTKYSGHQLGNAAIKDTVFTKKYTSLFPNVMFTWTVDSSNELSLNVDRRIDRPPYQKLNPFVFIINKYTYQLGNPSFLPQFTWSATLSHSYKGMLVSSISYSTTSNYFSQLFYSNPDGLVIYTEGNVGSATDLGASVSLQLNPFKWWDITTAVSVDDKTIKGEVINPIHSTIFQGTLNINNQFHFGKNWSAEISGYYNSKSQVDIQEILDPAGQLAAGVSKLLLKKKLNVKLGVRDIFHTQVMKGLTQFQLSNEYFVETRDTRMATISLSYHFGKTLKSNHHLERAAEEEIRRTENGG